MVALLAAGLAGYAFVFDIASVESAPQQAAVSAQALAIAAIPYCFARAWSEIKAVGARQRERSKLKEN